MGEFEKAEFEELIKSNTQSVLGEFYEMRTLLNSKLTKDEMLSDEESLLLRKIKAVIGKSEPKPTNLCYFAAKLSPIELWRFNVKGKFYIPNFLLTTTNLDLLSEIPEGNVIFEIDNSQFNSFSMIVTNDIYLISCYNTFEWEEYRRDEKGRNIVRLRVLNYHFQNKENKIDKVPRSNTTESNAPLSQLENLQAFLDRSISSEQLDDLYHTLLLQFRIVRSDLEKSPVQPKGRPMRVQIYGTEDDEALLKLLHYPPKEIEAAMKGCKGDFLQALLQMIKPEAM